MTLLRRSLFVCPLLLLAACAAGTSGGTLAGSGAIAACTKEAKICPDGSAVGRTGPSCEFAPCPGESSASGDASAGTDTGTSLSDGMITLPDASAPFAMAREPEEILKHSSIPPCTDGFTHCYYYDGSAYDGTNFDSAGLGVAKRADLATESGCLTTPPNGASGKAPAMHADSAYKTSLFEPLGDGAMGHFTHDSVYRLFVSNTCYEFRARVGQSQYANYPAGSVREFTANDEAELTGELGRLLGLVTLHTGERVVFP